MIPRGIIYLFAYLVAAGDIEYQDYRSDAFIINQ